MGHVFLWLLKSVILDIAMDWSDHAIWWPTRNIWLDKTRWTLDQYTVNADTVIHFTPMHKTLRIQLPDLRYVDCTVDFSVKTFNAGVVMCRDLGLRHPEELSLCKPLDPEHLKQNYQEVMMRRRPPVPTKEGNTGERIDTNTFVSQTGTLRSPNTSMNTPTSTLKTPRTHRNSPQIIHLGGSRGIQVNIPGFSRILQFMFRYKYYSFYDLNPKYDSTRINQIYEQARWQLLNEEVDCTEEEMMLFAALQLQVAMQANVPQPATDEDETDDVDEELKKLQMTLEGGGGGGWNSVTEDPSMSDYLMYFKGSGCTPCSCITRPKRFTLKSYKRLYFVLKNLYLMAFKSAEAAKQEGNVLFTVILKGCEVTPLVNLAASRYEVKLEVPSADGMSDIYLRFTSENQYADWLAASRLAAKGKTLADSSFEMEVNSIKAFLSMQSPAASPAINPASIEINPDEYVAPRFAKKMRSKIRQKILESHTNVKDLNLIEAKMNFVRAWQSLPEYGVSLFVVRFHGEKKDELLGVASNRVMRMSLQTGDHIKTWRYSTMKAWNVNWETRHMMIQFEDDKNVIFQCLSADCKVIHEFIGGYIFLSMRSKDSNQQLNQELFHKLTGGWI
ncbi:unc-112-related protein [Eurytemora carolleeae]|uniref:unc-112-related protein n=1 Tax=Eurytemora carolleeae TaxID=1294199 RepID=UPI000C758C5F|nr:unc-112-related protein [Eurytemora carolleeae]|eukprot:XP_023324423.1 unc-112-related protein-like [Eurytemora affinis]